MSIVLTCNVLSLTLQLTSLVTLGLLSQIGGSGDPLESPKYKCLVSLDFVKSISRFVFCAICSIVNQTTLAVLAVAMSNSCVICLL